MAAPSAEQSIIDVEMKNVDSPAEEVTDSEQKGSDASIILDIRENIRQIERGVATKESRFITRILRTILAIRKDLNSNILTSVVNGFYTHSASEKEFMLSFFDDQMEVESALVPVAGANAQRMRTAKNSSCPLLPEVDAYIHLLLILYLIDQSKYVAAQKCSDALMDKLSAHSRRTLDLIQARSFFYHMRAYELNDQLDACRPLFHAKLRTATLRNDFEGQAVLINCLLRSYLHYSLYDQADKLVSKSVFPETASNNEWARFLYYVGRIKAIRLEYTEAHTNLVQALRKAPQTTAVGFRQAVQKLVVTVELLLGDIPDRLIFREAAMRTALQPYFELTQAVRLGNLHTFSDVLNKFSAQFRLDKTFLMIIRLRHNVIKTGELKSRAFLLKVRESARLFSESNISAKVDTTNPIFFESNLNHESIRLFWIRISRYESVSKVDSKFEWRLYKIKIILLNLQIMSCHLRYNALFSAPVGQMWERKNYEVIV